MTVVSDSNAVVFGPFPNHCFDILDVHRVNLGKWFVQDVEGSIAMQQKIQFGQPCLATGEFINGRIMMPGELGEAVDKGPVVHSVQFKCPVQLQSLRNQSPLRKILDGMADNLPVNRLFVYAHHHILHPQTAHQRPEQNRAGNCCRNRLCPYHRPPQD